MVMVEALRHVHEPLARDPPAGEETQKIGEVPQIGLVGADRLGRQDPAAR